MADKKFDESEGVWRTVGGRHIFIRNGQSLSDAMKESGKFKRTEINKDLYEKTDKESKEIEEKLDTNKESKKEEVWKKQDDGSYVADKDAMKKDYEERHKKYDEKIKQLAEDRENMTNSDWEASIMAYEKQNADGTYKSFGDIYQDIEEYENKLSGNTKNEYTKDELKEKFGTDNVDLINTGREDYRRVSLKEDEPFELNEDNISESYRTYREKRDSFEGITTDELGNRDYENMKDADWTGKEYTNEEFLANLEDENWHTERKMLLDAGLTNKQMEFVKDNTTFHNGSPSLDTEITEELIKGAKGEKYRTPQEIISSRNKAEIESLKKELDIVSQGGRYDENGKKREGVKEFGSYDETKERYKQLTGKDYDDSNIKIPYDPKKTYEYPNGVKINQDLMKERYSGVDVEDIQRDIDFNKKYLMNYNPKDRELHNAEIQEMQKYVDSQPKYESRISDDFGTEDWKEGYGSYMGSPSWKGTKSNSGLYGKDKIKAIDDEIKKAYPDLKTSRKTGRGGYTDSFSYSILESDEPIVRNINDFSDTEIERLWNKGYNRNYYNTKEDFKDHLKKELESGHFSVNEYNIKEDYALTPYGKQVFRDIMKVSNAYNYDESDSMTDYFNRGHYIDLYVGKDGKPYKANGTSKKTQKQSNSKTTNNTMNDVLRQKAYEKYLKEHPASKMSFEEFKKEK